MAADHTEVVDRILLHRTLLPVEGSRTVGIPSHHLVPVEDRSNLQLLLQFAEGTVGKIEEVAGDLQEWQ